jgi:hypothetical protein
MGNCWPWRCSKKKQATSCALGTVKASIQRLAVHAGRRCRQMAAGTPGEATPPADCTLVDLVRYGQTPLNESGVLRGEADRTAGRRPCRLEVTTAQRLLGGNYGQWMGTDRSQ